MTLRDALEADLADHLVDDEPPPEAFDEPPPPVEDQTAADGQLRRLGRLQAQEDEIRDVYDTEKSRLDSWLEDRLAGVNRERAWRARALEAFARRLGRATVKLPHGQLRLRTPRGRVVIDDAEAFRAWVEANDYVDLVRVTVEPNKTALGQLVQADESAPTADGGRAHPLLATVESPQPGEDATVPVPGVSFVKSTEPTFTWEAGTQ